MLALNNSYYASLGLLSARHPCGGSPVAFGGSPPVAHHYAAPSLSAAAVVFL